MIGTVTLVVVKTPTSTFEATTMNAARVEGHMCKLKFPGGADIWIWGYLSFSERSDTSTFWGIDRS